MRDRILVAALQVFLVGPVTSTEDWWESMILRSPLHPPGESSSLLREKKKTAGATDTRGSQPQPPRAKMGSLQWRGLWGGKWAGSRLRRKKKKRGGTMGGRQFL